MGIDTFARSLVMVQGIERWYGEKSLTNNRLKRDCKEKWSTSFGSGIPFCNEKKGFCHPLFSSVDEEKVLGGAFQR